jgi:predicted Co/Zn/Cd cation transporter (cation efflux family)
MTEEKGFLKKIMSSKYMSKWEYGFIIGFIIGVLGLSVVSAYTNPMLILILTFQIVTLYVILIQKEKAKKQTPPPPPPPPPPS